MEQWMTLSMDSRGHYGWLHPWMPQRKGNKVIWHNQQHKSLWRTFWTLPRASTFVLLWPCLCPDWRQSQSHWHMQKKKTSVLKLTKQQQDSWQVIGNVLFEHRFRLLLSDVTSLSWINPWKNSFRMKKINLEIKFHAMIVVLNKRCWCFCRFLVEYRQSNHDIVVWIDRCLVWK